jgi:class 3 adenylate cyclase
MVTFLFADIESSKKLREEIRPQSLRVRACLRSGEAELRAGDNYDSVLNRAVRLMSASHGGQALNIEHAIQYAVTPGKETR